MKEQCILAAEQYERCRLKEGRRCERYELTQIPPEDVEDTDDIVSAAIVLGLYCLTQSTNPIISLSFFGLSLYNNGYFKR